MLTIYHHPEKSIPAEKALFVMGSTAAGTMSPVSKIVFAARPEADAFAATCGGTVVDYSRALLTAKVSVVHENKTINKRRIEKGKILEPKQEDNCVVCGMSRRATIREMPDSNQRRQNPALLFLPSACSPFWGDRPLISKLQ